MQRVQFVHLHGDHIDHGEQQGARRVEWPAKEQARVAPHAARALSSGASSTDVAVVEKVTITPEHWLKASRPWRTTIFLTAEQSSADQDER